MSFLTKNRLAAILVFIVSIMAIISGGQVLLGLSKPSYHVIPLLVFYNVIVALIGLADGWGLWTVRTWAEKLALCILVAHFLVLVILLVMRLLEMEVAIQSVGAMTFRVLVWSVINLLVRKSALPKATV